MNKILALATSMALFGITSMSANEIGQVKGLTPQAINPATEAAMRLANGLSTDGPAQLIPASKAPRVRPGFKPVNSPMSFNIRHEAPAVKGEQTADRAKQIKASLFWSAAWGSKPRFGMYSMPVNSPQMTLITPEDKCEAFDYVANGGGTAFGNGYYYMTSYAYRETNEGIEVTDVMNTVFNNSTWEVMNCQLQKDSYGKPVTTSISLAMTSDPVSGTIYGQFFGNDPDNYSFGIYDPYKYSLSVIKLTPDRWAACSFDTDGTLYALKHDGTLCKVDKRTGEETLVGNTGLQPHYDSTGAINPDDHKMYYVLTNDYGTSMYKIDLATASASKAFDFENDEQLFGMYFSDPDASTLAPAEPVNLEALFRGTLNGTVSFNLPETTIGGDRLTGNLNWTVSVNYAKVKTGTGTPGQKVEFDLSVEEEGALVIEAYCSNDDGTGKSAIIIAYAGDVPALPMAPRNAVLREDTENWGRTYVNWEAPETDVNGKPINPDDVVYYILNNSMSQRYTEYPGTTLVHDMGDLSEIQEYEHLLIMSGALINGKYEYNWDTFAITPYMSIGKPYTLPFRDPIGRQGFKYNWVNMSSLYNGHWYLWDGIEAPTYSIRPYNNDGGMVVFNSEQDDALSEIRGGKIDLGNAEHPAFFFQIYKRTYSNSTVGIIVHEVKDAVVVKSSEPLVMVTNTAASEEETGWHEVKVPLDEFKGKMVQISVLVFSPTKNVYVPLDNFEVRNVLDHDLGLADFTTPFQMLPGRNLTFGMKLTNWGLNSAPKCDVTLYRNGKAIATQTVTDMAPAEVRNLVFTDMATPLYDENCSYWAEVTYGADQDLSNNTTQVETLNLVQYDYPEPTVLTGEVSGNDVNLMWDEPQLIPEEAVTESFETYDGFIIDGIGDWKVADLDKNDSYYIENPDGEPYPNYGVPQAWQVFNNSTFPTEVYAPHSGKQFIISFTSLGENNDWLISPRLSGNEQTIRFYASGADQYAENPATADKESFEVLYSTGSTDPADFILLQTRNRIPNFWMAYEFPLPKGAVHFAIRHIGSFDDSFALLVDDITYEREGFDNLSLMGFNIYRDGEKINTGEPHAEIEFTDANASDKRHTYHVTAVYAEGESRPSAPFEFVPLSVDAISASGVTVEVANGVISVSGAAGLNVSVHDIAGRTMASGVAADMWRAAVPAGVYVVKVGNEASKVIVK